MQGTEINPCKGFKSLKLLNPKILSYEKDYLFVECDGWGFIYG